MWISFKDRQPEEGKFLITRFRGFRGKGSGFENWSDWNKINLDICYEDGSGHITHWWDGPKEMNLAIKEWKKEI